MDTPTIGSTTQSSSQQSVGGNKFADLSSNEFMKVLLSELKNQDPMKPQDTTALMEQLSSLRNIESQTTLQNQLKNLVTQNQLAGAGNMIGKMVTGLSEGNDRISGLVSSVRVKEDQVLLELDNGQQLPMSRVTGITRPAASSATGSTNGG